MTFYEAAVEILRSAGRPLHVKKITSLSVEQNLLTHVGRDPEKTMRTRLAQEIAKTSESLVRTVRPNVYALRDDADITDAKQTIQPRAVELPESEDPPVVVENEPTDAKHHEKKGDRRNNRSQRASSSDNRQGQHKNERSSSQERDASSSSRDDRSARKSDQPQQDGDARPKSSTKQEANGRSQSHANVTHHASPAAQKLAQLRDQDGGVTHEPAGDLATHIQQILQEAPEQTLPLQEIGHNLDKTAYASLPTLPNTALQGALTRANARRAESGQPPLFTSTRDGRWTLIQEKQPLAKSLEAFQQWQEQHHLLLRRRLEHVLAERSHAQILGIVALVMERLEYQEIELHAPEDEELGTFSATIDHGLSQTRIAARVFAMDRPITRLDVMAFRGNLHQYNAQRGVIITLGGHSLCAREQVDAPGAAPIVLMHDGKLAELMIRTHVGTLNLNVSVPHLDHAFFA